MYLRFVFDNDVDGGLRESGGGMRWIGLVVVEEVFHVSQSRSHDIRYKYRCCSKGPHPENGDARAFASKHLLQLHLP